jgi:hypothetical protein
MRMDSTGLEVERRRKLYPTHSSRYDTIHSSTTEKPDQKPQILENSRHLLDTFRGSPALSFQDSVAAIRQGVQPRGRTTSREGEEEDFMVELNNLRKELADMRASEEKAPSSPARSTFQPSTPTTVRQSRLPVPSPSPWKTAFQPTQKGFATPQTVRKLQFGPLPSPVLRIPAPSFHQSKNSDGSGQTIQSPTTALSPGRPRVDSTPKTIKREQAKRKALNLPAPASRPSILMTPLPSTNLSTMFGDTTMDQASNDVLPPFTSPWRTPLKSSETPHRTPRKSVLWGSGTFKRTPLKSGVRLSSILPPVHQSYYLAGVATVQPNLGTPRASLDEACDEVRIHTVRLQFPFVSYMHKRVIDCDWDRSLIIWSRSPGHGRLRTQTPLGDAS